MIKRVVKNLTELDDLSKDFLNKVSEKTFVLLDAKMGCGKTTFIKHILKNLNFHDVSSPTFSLINKYETTKGNVYHIDLYRLEKLDNFILNELEEISKNHFLTFIEWPFDSEKIIQEFNQNIIKISILKTEEERLFEITS